MSFGRAAAAISLACLPFGPVYAQGFTGMQNDHALMSALNEMSMTLGTACQMGNNNGCQGFQYIQNAGNYMMGASNACMMGDRNACAAYQQGYMQLNQDYGQFRAQYAAPQQMPPGGANPLGQTHQERMDAIRNFGQQNTQNWQNNMNQMDESHRKFMETLRN